MNQGIQAGGSHISIYFQVIIREEERSGLFALRYSLDQKMSQWIQACNRQIRSMHHIIGRVEESIGITTIPHPMTQIVRQGI